MKKLHFILDKRHRKYKRKKASERNMYQKIKNVEHFNIKKDLLDMWKELNEIHP